MTKEKFQHKSGRNNDKHAEPQRTRHDETVTIPASEYEALKEHAQQKDDAHDKYLRVHADFENALKRLDKEREAFLRYANESLILEFLPIVDNLEMAERSIKEAKDFDAVRKGVDMIHSQIQKFLKELGVERIKCIGEKFNPDRHEVMEACEADDREEDTIIEELKPGYMLHGRLLRPVSVKVVKRKTETNN
jgi:molecular chaperone GrpE